MRRFPFTRFGPAINPVGEYIALTVGERTYLGEVTRCYRDDVRGMTHVDVKHFNGEPWPFSPALGSVEWIAQD